MSTVMRPWCGEEEAAAAAAAVSSGWVAQGPRVAEFEAAFGAAIGSGHGVAVSSCTAALHLAMVAGGIGPGDEVVVPSLSFIAPANAVRYVGAKPVFADVDLATQNLTPATVEPHLTHRTRAVILVDQAGVPADLDAMRALCEPRGIIVVEDAACAVGSTYRGHAAGAGVLAAFSFHPRKLLTTRGGGMLLPPDSPVSRDELLRKLADAGISARRGIMAAHTEPAYADVSSSPLPVTDRLSSSSLILPLFHEMTESEQDQVVSVIRSAAESRSRATPDLVMPRQVSSG